MFANCAITSLLVQHSKIFEHDTFASSVPRSSIATEPLGYVLRRIVERAVGVGRFALPAQRQPSARVDADIAGEEAPGATKRDLRLQGVIEILTGNNIEMVRDTRAQRVRQIHLFAGNCDLHHASPRGPS